MDPLPPTPFNQAITGGAGFAAGVIAQVLFRLFVSAVIGPIPALFSIQMLVLVIILLIPPVASYMFLEVVAGSLKERFIHALQLGSLFWFVLILVTILT